MTQAQSKSIPISQATPQAVAEAAGMKPRRVTPLWVWYDRKADKYCAEYPELRPSLKDDAGKEIPGEPARVMASAGNENDAVHAVDHLRGCIILWCVQNKIDVPWRPDLVPANAPPDAKKLNIALAY